MSSNERKINWAVPSDEDIAYLKSLSREERTSLLLSHLDSVKTRPNSKLTHDDIWQEALSRAKSAA